MRAATSLRMLMGDALFIVGCLVAALVVLATYFAKPTHAEVLAFCVALAVAGLLVWALR